MIVIAPGNAETLKVTVYDKAGVGKSDIEDAADVLKRVFRNAGIDIDVALGDRSAAEASLILYTTPASPANLKEASCHARRDIAVDLTQSPRGLRDRVLGMSHPFAPAGLNVLIFVNQIRDAAAGERRQFSTVLAYAIAHEIGHVLVKTDAHEKQGIMAAVWSRQQYDWMASGILLFSRTQEQRMHATLMAQGCPAPEILARADTGEKRAE